MRERLASAIIVVTVLLTGGLVSGSSRKVHALACGPGDRGRAIGYQLVASYPSPESVKDYFDSWIAFYQDYYQFPPDIPATFLSGFDSYKVAYCTIDAVLPGQSSARPTMATGMVSVPRAAGPLPTVAYLHGTSVSFYDAVSNPAIAGPFNPGGESFDGPPSNAVFAGGGFIYVGPDYLGLGDSSVPRHRYFHMRHYFDDVVAALAPNAHALLRSSFSAAVRSDPATPLRVRLRENAVDRWRPSAPLLVYHSPDDEEVLYEDALVSVNRLLRRGADVTVEALPGFDHVNSWIQAMPRAVEWFRSLER